MATTVLSSASGVLSLLDEPEPLVQVHALRTLDGLVPVHWSEIAPHIEKIETLYEDESFVNRDLAAVVASKVFYHLEELDQALMYALGAGSLFDVDQASEYVQTLVAKALDEYVRLRSEAFDVKEEPKVDPRLEGIVERMFERCYADGKYEHALGVAVECRRLDVVRKAIVTSDDVAGMLQYAFVLSSKVIVSREFRQKVFAVLTELYRGLPVPDYINLCQCLLFLDDHAGVAAVLDGLLEKGDPEMAYQVGFDLHENQNQPFLLRVLNALPPSSEAKADPAAPPAEEDGYASQLTRLKDILSGKTATHNYLQFLYGHNHTDLNILKQIKDKLEPRNSVTHNATVMAHSIMQCGTTVDVFLRDNLEWLARATNWAKFTATASLGVIHKGHITESSKILEPYLPKPGSTGSAYQEGGALYALGLIHAQNFGDKAVYLQEALKNAGSNEILQHGACLGLGLVAMATQNSELYEEVKAVVFTESAVAGQAAGLAMGLILLGSGNGEALEEMLKYAHETQHERIIRGLAMGMALIVYGREEEADTLIEQMIRDKDPILRYGGCTAISMAYVGTSNNTAIRKLLHVAVSDVNDDVRRSAVVALGFVLCANPDQVPRIVSLLAESYNPHVRYGSCMAVGIACAGLGHKEAIALLEPLLKDRVDFVKQGAFIAMSMVLIQHNEVLEPKVKAFRKAITEIIGAKTETMQKVGAIIGAGILDAGGRNVTLTMISAAGHKRMAAIVGMAIFPQFWYWYPEAHFLSLAFTPTAVIGLNKNLKMPKQFEFRSNAPPSLFAYPPPIEIKVEEKKKDVKKATLSSAKARARKKKEAEEKKEAEAKGSMDTKDDTGKDTASSPSASSSSAATPDVAMGETPKAAESTTTSNNAPAEEDKKTDEKKKTKKKELKSELLSNPARVTWKQRLVLSFDDKNARYTPVKKEFSGITMLRDSKPGEPEDLVVAKPPKIGVLGVSDDEPAPPAPFQFLR